MRYGFFGIRTHRKLREIIIGITRQNNNERKRRQTKIHENMNQTPSYMVVIDGARMTD